LSLIPPSSPEGQNLEIHMYERLPTPYGLVRYGVAPDHPEVKVCFLCLGKLKWSIVLTEKIELPAQI
ncbi:hypothetical protein, partial [Escherichia coli]